MDCYGVEMDGIVKSHHVDTRDQQSPCYFLLLQHPGTSLKETDAHDTTEKGMAILNNDNTIMDNIEVTEEVYNDAVKTGHIRIMFDPRIPRLWFPLVDYTAVYVTLLKSCAGTFLITGVMCLLWWSFGDIVIILCIANISIALIMVFMMLLSPLFTLLSFFAPVYVKGAFCGAPMDDNGEVLKTNWFLVLLFVLLSPILLVFWIHRKGKKWYKSTFPPPEEDVGIGTDTSTTSPTSESLESTATTVWPQSFHSLGMVGFVSLQQNSQSIYIYIYICICIHDCGDPDHQTLLPYYILLHLMMKWSKYLYTMYHYSETLY